MAAEGERFADDWLALREPADHAARSGRLAEMLSRSLADRWASEIVDLGAGTGSNLRWLAPRLPGRQKWRLIDHDARLLECVGRPSAAAGASGQAPTIETCCLDLAALPDDIVEGADVVTASALFDIVSRQWIEQLAGRLGASGAAGLFALTVDGRRWFVDSAGRAIADAEDRYMAELFNRHQRRAKGLGEALGPDAARVLPDALRRVGMAVHVETADWRLAAGETGTMALGSALIEDWSRAAAEATSGQSPRIDRWRRERLAALEGGALGLGVGHVDVLALAKAHD
jgi:hypothetical protein